MDNIQTIMNCLGDHNGSPLRMDFPHNYAFRIMHYEFYYGIAPTDGHLNNYELKIMHHELKKGVICQNHAFFLLMV